MTTKLTDAQAEVIEELWSNGYGSVGFLPHELFRERDNRANGMRRTLRGLIARGLAVKDERTTDGRGNYYYTLAPSVPELYQDWQRRK